MPFHLPLRPDHHKFQPRRNGFGNIFNSLHRNHHHPYLYRVVIFRKETDSDANRKENHQTRVYPQIGQIFLKNSEVFSLDDRFIIL